MTRFSSLLLTLFAWVGSTFVGCVRASEPDSFACGDDSDCSKKEVCLNFECRPEGECITDFHCEQRQMCVSNRCMDVACTEDSHCGERQRCSVNQCYDVECTLDSHCATGVCIAYACHECNGPERCAPYACVNLTCANVCNSDAGCAPGYVCDQTVCVPQEEACTGACLATGEVCASNEHCIQGHCCATSASSGVCQAAACPAAGLGETCGIGTSCGDGVCRDGRCVAELGEACQKSEDCVEGECCAKEDGTKACADECDVITGDYCLVYGCDNGGWCDGLTNFPDDGFCSRACDDGCGYNSLGVENVCVPNTPGSSPASACRPGCETTADCQAVHPDLVCLDDGTRTYCDF